jgi:alpha-ketoglutarate-dependent taurine dioxygenase
MKPINDSAKRVVHLMSEMNTNLWGINWSGNKAIIIDNWKMLHGRREAKAGEKRELKRIYIN